jgi:hypothetical protein
MATRIFDRETLLDLVVNAVPLFIMGFFVVAFVLFAPFGFDPLASLLQFGIVIGSFVALVVLTYVSAQAIAGAEKNGPVFLPGQTTPPEAAPIEERHGTDESGDHAEPTGASGAPEEPGLPSDGAEVETGAGAAPETVVGADDEEAATGDDGADEADEADEKAADGGDDGSRSA